MSALAPVLAVSVLSVCLFHALPGVAAENLPRSECGTKPADIVFLLDTSYSVREDNFYKVKEFLKQFVQSVQIGPMDFNVGVVTFASSVNNVFWLNAHTTKSALLQAIDMIPYEGGVTRTDLGLEYVRQEAFTKAHGDRNDANNILVVVTDGVSSKPNLTAEEANKLHNTDIKVIAIGIGIAVQRELKTIASDEESVFGVTNFDALKSIEEGLKITACEAAVDPVHECGKKPADIVFLLDTSYSVGDDNFDKVKEFVKQFVKSVKIGPLDFNVGVVTFASSVSNVFWLNTHTTKSSLLQAIDMIPYHKGVTNTYLGLEFVRLEAFTKAHGNRDDANNILVVVTDGMSVNQTLTADQANKLHKTDIKVIAVGVGVALQKELETIASDEDNVFGVTNFDALKSIEEGLKITACEVAEEDNQCGSKQADIVFLLDSSISVGVNDFDKVKEFLKQFVKSVKIGPLDFHVGVVTFASSVNDVIWLNTHTTKSSLLQAIDMIPYIEGATNTYLGLEFVRLEAFTKAHGNRDDVSNILVVVTDGMSIDPTLTADQANKLHKTDIKVIAIGVGFADQKELKTIASDEENVFEVTNFDALKSIEEGLKTTACEGCKKELPADIVFLLDTSGSVKEENFEKVREFLKQFVKSVKIGPMDFNVGIVTFASSVHNVFWLNTHIKKSLLLEAIDKIPYKGGGTRTYLGLEFVRQEAFTKAHGDRDDANNILVVVTDGKSFNETLTANQANELHKTDIKVIAIGVGRVDETELKAIASDEESVFEVTNFDALKSIQEGLKTTACEGADDECRALSGDIVFLLDSSGSVGPANFEKVKDFVKRMAKSFNIGPDEVNIGVVTFETTTHDEFWLNHYTSESDLLEAIDRIPYHDGTTNTDMALSYVRQVAFSQTHGDRNDAANILIVITDGMSENPGRTQEEAEKIHKSDVTVLVIGIGEFVDEPELEIIANGKENVFDVTDFSALDTVKGKLTKTACTAIAATSSGSRRAVAAARRYVFRDNEE